MAPSEIKHPEPKTAAVSDAYPPARIGIFARTGEYWTIGLAGDRFSLKDLKGLHYVERLLRHPGEEFHVLDLVNESGADTNSDNGPISLSSESGLSISRLGDAGPKSDVRSLEEYKLRLRELREELEELRESGAHERAENVQDQIDFLVRHIAGSFGLRGRPRPSGSAAEKARVKVTNQIRTAVKKISEYSDALGKLLDHPHIQTGLSCVYLPDPTMPVSWQFSFEGTPSADERRSPAPRIGSIIDSTVVRPSIFVGREAERTVLRRHLDQLLKGVGGVVMISGAAGVGKTTIAEEFRLEASGKGVRTLMGGCYDRDDPLPFVPFVEMLEPIITISRSADIREMLGEDIAEIARLLPQLHRLFPDIAPPLVLPPKQSRRVLFNAIARVLARMSTAQPLLLVLDDLHWADEGTLSLVNHLGSLVSQMPVLLVGTYRDFELKPDRPLAHPIEELIRRHVLEEINLSGLAKPAVAKIIETLAGREPPEEVAGVIYSGTEGNSFFIKELVQHLIEQGRLLDPNGEFRRDLTLDELNVPRTVRLVIGKRIARLSDGAQKILATAAVIGRAFNLELLQEVSHQDADSVLDWIEEAENAALIDSHLQHPEVLFRFGHELIRQTVTNALSHARRQRLHLHIADAIERLYPNAVPDHVDDLAHHLWEAGGLVQVNRVINHLTAAAKHASKRGAYEAAIPYLRHGLEATKRLPDSPERLHQELSLYLDLRDPLIATKGFLDAAVEEVCARARVLLEQIGDTAAFFSVSVLGGLVSIYFNRGELSTARELAEKMLRISTTSEEPALLLWAYYALGFVCESQAEYVLARDNLERCLALYDRGRAGLYGFVVDPGATAFLCLAIVVYRLGYPDLALKKATDGLALARDINHPFTLALVLGLAGEILIRRGEENGAIPLFEEAVSLCAKHGLEGMLDEARIRLGWALVSRGCVQEGIKQILDGRARAKVDRSFSRGLLALAYGRAGRPDQGLKEISQALDKISERRNKVAWLHQLKGELLLMHQADGEAENCFRRAISIAISQNDKAQELAATICLSRLLGRPSPKEAYTILSEVLGWFTEGFETRDLREARALLDELKR